MLAPGRVPDSSESQGKAVAIVGVIREDSGQVAVNFDPIPTATDTTIRKSAAGPR